MGDEGEMIRKMRIGQLQAAAISNAGLAEIDPRAYALMLPMMFDSYEEWDYVRQEINLILEANLKEKGFKSSANATRASTRLGSMAIASSKALSASLKS